MPHRRDVSHTQPSYSSAESPEKLAFNASLRAQSPAAHTQLLGSPVALARLGFVETQPAGLFWLFELKLLLTRSFLQTDKKFTFLAVGFAKARRELRPAGKC